MLKEYKMKIIFSAGHQRASFSMHRLKRNRSLPFQFQVLEMKLRLLTANGTIAHQVLSLFRRECNCSVLFHSCLFSSFHFIQQKKACARLDQRSYRSILLDRFCSLSLVHTATECNRTGRHDFISLCSSYHIYRPTVLERNDVIPRRKERPFLSKGIESG